MKYVAFSFGHSRRAYSEFLQKLQQNKIEILVDARSFPRSRFCPHFNQKALSQELSKANITYLFKGSNLGGLGENIDYEETMDELVKMIKGGSKVCFMCSEKNFRECHRFSMLTPSLEERGVSVEHIE